MSYPGGCVGYRGQLQETLLGFHLFRLELRSDEDEKEATKERTQEEKAEIIELGALADVGDHSDRLLYLAKAGQWDAARSLLLSNLHFNFGLTDKVGNYRNRFNSKRVGLGWLNSSSACGEKRED